MNISKRKKKIVFFVVTTMLSRIRKSNTQVKNIGDDRQLFRYLDNIYIYQNFGDLKASAHLGIFRGSVTNKPQS